MVLFTFGSDTKLSKDYVCKPGLGRHLFLGTAQPEGCSKGFPGGGLQAGSRSVLILALVPGKPGAAGTLPCPKNKPVNLSCSSLRCLRKGVNRKEEEDYYLIFTVSLCRVLHLLNKMPFSKHTTSAPCSHCEMTSPHFCGPPIPSLSMPCLLPPPPVHLGRSPRTQFGVTGSHMFKQGSQP